MGGAKIFDRVFEGYKPKRINEDKWFEIYQTLLIQLVNTNEGRDFFCIDQNFPKIDKIAKNYIRTCLGQVIANGEKRIAYINEFRVGAKYANIIRYRWNDFLKTVQFLNNRHLFDFSVFSYPMVSQFGRRFDSLTAYPDPDPESTTVDGFIENGDTVWATAQGATDGDSALPSNTSLQFASSNSG